MLQMAPGDNLAGADHRPKVLIIGPVPPPTFGVAKATSLMLGSPALAERLQILHLDTSDRRSVANIGRFDFSNVWLALKHAAQLARLLDHERPRVTLLTASQGTLGLLRDEILTLLSRGFGSKVAVYMRGSGYADLRTLRGRPAAWILRFIVKRSALVLVLGTSLVDMARRVYAKANIVVVPNGSPPVVRPEAVGKRDNTHPVVLYVGRLSRRKGLDEVMEAARILAVSIPDLELVVAGDWESHEYETHVNTLLKEYGLAARARFPGPVGKEEKGNLMTQAWVLVLPSHSEGQPWVILEAMSAGVPVVATDTGTIAETVENGVAGFVVPTGDSAALAQRVNELLTDDDLWSRMSKGAVKRYQENYTMEQSHRRLADELCRIARGN